MNITLIGMPGAGKSTFGKIFAKRYRMNFIDVDKVIEKKIGMKLQEFIDKFGDKKFSEIEEKTILELGNVKNTVISPGGSAVYSPPAIEFLRKQSFIVFISRRFEYLNNRLKNRSIRGIIGLKNKTLKKLFYERDILYKKYADITITPKNFNARFLNDFSKILLFL